MALSIAALITNFNTWQLSQKCISELIRWSDNTLSRILVIDDASEESIPKSLPGKVKVVQNPCNKGYVASVNIGFSQMDDDIVILLDSDAYPLVDLAKPLTAIFEADPALGAVGFNLVDEDGKSTGSYHSEPHALGLLLGQQLEARIQSLLPFLQNRPICLYSCGMAIRRIAFDAIGGFDENFDFLDADIDFSMSLRRANWKVHYRPELLAFHKGGGSFQTTSTRVVRYHTNRWRLLDKHGYLPPATISIPALATRHFLEYCTLKVVGQQLIKDPVTFKDKLDSRQKLLRQVWSGYGNKN
jgi:hypothetical protein